MSKVVNLTVHKNTLLQRKLKATRQALRQSIKSIDIDYDSWVLVAFKREPDELLHYVDYVIEDSALIPLLPKMVEHFIKSAIILREVDEENNG